MFAQKKMEIMAKLGRIPHSCRLIQAQSLLLQFLCAHMCPA